LSPNFNIQKVLVAPLDWGLGHATRCIPIIRALLKKGYQVVLAAEGAQASLLANEFPALQILPLAGYRVKYSKNKWWLPITLLLQLPRLLRIIKYENRWLDSVIDEHKIDLVISDNRYGLFTKKVACIFITHQLTIKAPLGSLEKAMRQINYSYINLYNSCWVPDVKDAINAAGVLSHPSKLPLTKVQYIGLLSRFEKQTLPKKYDYCILLSGPEPQRTLLENKIIEGLDHSSGKIIIVRGKPGTVEIIKTSNNIEVKNHLPGPALEEVIQQSDYIVCRSGYTTVMELLSLQKKSILIPTPGQTEQEYLAKKLAKEQLCMYVEQDVFNCAEHFAKAKNFPYQLTELPVFDEDAITQLLEIATNPKPETRNSPLQ
jgi:uncharacterized protein (TIGR00661 family)